MKLAVKKKLFNLITPRIQKVVNEGSEIIKAATPIDTQRLYESTRPDTVSIDYTLNTVGSKILIGGISLYGIRRERDILKPVDYASFVEFKYNYVRSVIKEIKLLALK